MLCLVPVILLFPTYSFHQVQTVYYTLTYLHLLYTDIVSPSALSTISLTECVVFIYSCVIAKRKEFTIVFNNQAFNSYVVVFGPNIYLPISTLYIYFIKWFSRRVWNKCIFFLNLSFFCLVLPCHTNAGFIMWFY